MIGAVTNRTNWTTRQVTVNGADVNTSVVFTKKVETGSLKIEITTTSVAVTYIKMQIGEEVRSFNGKYGDYSYITVTDIPIGTHDLSVIQISGDNGGGSISNCSGLFSPSSITIKSGQTSNVSLHCRHR